MLAQHFSRQCSGTTDGPEFKDRRVLAEKNKIIFNQDNSQPYNVEISEQELRSALSSCISKSPGPDSLPYDIIRNLSGDQFLSLLDFYNYIFQTGFPHQWRMGLIVPIAKPNKIATSKLSFRSITLTNCLCKLMGKVLNKRLQHTLESTQHFSPFQSGFRASHCTYDGLIRYHHSANDALRNGKYCIAA